MSELPVEPAHKRLKVRKPVSSLAPEGLMTRTSRCVSLLSCCYLVAYPVGQSHFMREKTAISSLLDSAK